MAEHVFSVLCTDAMFEDGSQVLTILRVVERVNVINVERMEAETPSFIPHPMKLVSQWVRTNPNKNETIKVRYSLVSPDGHREDSGVVLEVDLQDSNTVRTIANIKGFPNRGFGVYWFEVNRSRDGKKWSLAARFPMQFGPLDEWQAMKGAREK